VVLNDLLCVDMPLRTRTLTHSLHKRTDISIMYNEVDDMFLSGSL